MNVKKRDVLSSFAIIGICGAGLILTRRLPASTREYDLGPAFLPGLVLWLIIFLCGLKVITALIVNDNKPVSLKAGRNAQGFSTIVLVGLYCFLYGPLGFLTDTFLYLPLQILIVTPKEKRRISTILLIDVISTVLIYLIFTKGFGLRLPRGLVGF